MNCAEAKELLGAYAVDALAEDEAARFRAHLATCAEHAAAAAELRAFASTLSATAEPIPPPPALRTRLLDAIAREPQLGAAAREAPRSISSARRSPREAAIPSRSPIAMLRAPQVWGTLAAAIIAGLLAWNIVLQGDSGDARLAASDADAVSSLLATTGGAPIGTVLYFEDEGKAVIVAEGITQVGPTQTYQMWAVYGESLISLGTMDADANGHATSTVDFDAARADSFAVTIEPPGGSAQPTSEPIAIARFGF